MFDLNKCKEEFLKYVAPYEEEYEYEKEFEGIERKKFHSLRVMEECKKLSEKLGLSDEQKEIAMLIGLLHDIGRFKQYTLDNRFLNEMILDHAKLGVEVLEKDDYIKKYIDDKHYIPIIFKAIENHNKYKIEESLNEEELLFSKIIRDADKLDILYEGAEIYWKSEEEVERVENSKINVKVEQQFKVERQVKKCGCEKNDTVDGVLILLSYIYDINFKEALSIVYKENFVKRILDRFNFKDEKTKKQMENLEEILQRNIILRLRKRYKG